MVNFPSIYDQLFEDLKEALSHNDFKPNLKARAPDDLASSNFPLVVFVESNNTFAGENLCHEDQLYTNQFEIDIYTQEKPLNGKKQDRRIVAESIRNTIDATFNSDTIRLKRTFCQPVPNVDLGIYRIQMRYRCTYRIDTNGFYRF